VKTKWILVGCIVSSTVIGWSAGYLRLPYFEGNSSFAIGFISGVAIVCLALILFSIWKKKVSISDFPVPRINSKSHNNEFSFIWTIFAILILVGGWSGLFFTCKKNAALKYELNDRNLKLDQQTQLLESSMESNSLALLNAVFDKISEEINISPNRTLSDISFAKIVTLNTSFQPYRVFEQDSLSAREFSPERGQLLMGLVSMDIDSNSFNQIKNEITFFGADLRKADLRGVDLGGIDLRNSNLREADLRGVDLVNSVLSDADLWGANLQKAKLGGSTLHRADLQWAELGEADLEKANLNGANLDNAKLGRADLHGVKLEWAKARNAYLSEADLSGANLTGTDFGGSNLRSANLRKATMNIVNLSDAIIDQSNLIDAELSKVTVLEKDWIQRLLNFEVIGATQIDSSYKAIVEPSGKYNFRLVKK